MTTPKSDRESFQGWLLAQGDGCGYGPPAPGWWGVRSLSRPSRGLIRRDVQATSLRPRRIRTVRVPETGRTAGPGTGITRRMSSVDVDGRRWITAQIPATSTPGSPGSRTRNGPPVRGGGTHLRESRSDPWRSCAYDAEGTSSSDNPSSDCPSTERLGRSGPTLLFALGQRREGELLTRANPVDRRNLAR